MKYTQKELRDTRMPLLRRLQRKIDIKNEKEWKKGKKVKFTKLNLYSQRWLLR